MHELRISKNNAIVIKLSAVGNKGGENHREERNCGVKGTLLSISYVVGKVDGYWRSEVREGAATKVVS